MSNALKSTRTIAFPEAEVEACILDALTTQAANQAIVQTPKPSSRPWEPDIDSLVAVEVICSVEELLGIKLPETFVPRGGYASTEECVNDLVSQAKVVWQEATEKAPAHAE